MPDEDTKHVNVRMPESLLVALQGAAKADARSLNSEIVVVLREWVGRRKRPAAERPEVKP